MGRPILVSLLLAASSATVALPVDPAQSPSSSVKVGDKAPDLTLPYLVPKDGGGFETREVRLSDYRGKQNVVLAFFPAAFSPGCTSEMTRYRDAIGNFTEANTVVFGVSVDSVWANRAFRDQIGVGFPILSDWKKEAARKYGLLDEESGFARRATFAIDMEGIVRHLDQDRAALDPATAVAACRLLKTR